MSNKAKFSFICLYVKAFLAAATLAVLPGCSMSPFPFQTPYKANERNTTTSPAPTATQDQEPVQVEAKPGSDAGSTAAAFSANSSSPQTLKLDTKTAPASLVGSSVTLPVGALSIDTNIQVQQGASIATAADASTLGLGQVITPASVAMVITPSNTSAKLSQPMTLAISMSEGQSLALAGNSSLLAIIFKGWLGDGTVTQGLITDGVTLDGNVVSFKTSYFGSFQVIRLTTAITAPVAAVRVAAPIVTQVAAATLPSPVWGNSLIMAQEDRTVKFARPLSGVTPMSCSLTINSSAGDSVISNASLSGTAYKPGNGMEVVYGTFSCVLTDGRSVTSSKSNQVVIEAVPAPQTPAPATVQTSPSVKSLSVSGVVTLEAGSSKTFSVVAAMSDGTANKTPDGKWSSSVLAVATVSSTGVVSAVASGSSVISFSNGTQSGELTLTVTPSTATSGTSTGTNTSTGSTIPSNVAVTQLSGNGEVGSLLTCSVTGGDSATFSYSWLAAPVGTFSYTVISGYTGVNLTVTSAMIHKQLLCKASVTAGSKTADSAFVVVNTPPASSFASNVSATTLAVGGSVNCYGSTSDADGDSLVYSYAWFSSSASEGSLAPINGATSNTLTVTSSMTHRYIKCRVSASDGYGGSTGGALSNEITVTNTSPVFSATNPNISVGGGGTAYVGVPLTCSLSPSNVTDADGDSVTLSPVWEASPTPGNAGSWATVSSGISGGVLTPTSAIARQSVRCKISANDGYGGGSVGTYSSNLALVNSAPVVTTTPSITSSFNVGDTIVCSPGAASDSDADSVTSSIQWETSSTGSSGWSSISGATSASYTVPQSQAHQYLRCRSTFSDGNGGSTVSASGGVQVSNSVPTVSTLTCNSINANLYQNNGAVPNFSCSLTGYSDVDGDSPVASITSNSCSTPGGFTASAISANIFSVNGGSQSSNCSLTMKVGDGTALATTSFTVNVTMKAFQSGSFGTPVLNGSCLLTVPLSLNVAIASQSRTGEAATIGGNAASVSFTDATGGAGTINGSVILSGVGATGALSTVYSAPNNDGSGTFSVTGSTTITAVTDLAIPSLLTVPIIGRVAASGVQSSLNPNVCLSCTGTFGSMSLGTDFAAFINASGGASLFGNTNEGNLGAGDGVNPVGLKAVRTATGLASGVKQVSVSKGGASFCAVKTNGTLFCGGKNLKGQLGNGSASNLASDVAVGVCDAGNTVPCPGVYINNAVAVSVGKDFTIGLLADGRAVAFGDATSGQLGTGQTGSFNSMPMYMVDASSTQVQNIISIAAGIDFACVVTTTAGNNVLCTGANTYGQQGSGASSDKLNVVAGISNATAVYAGGYTACAIVSGGSVYCWGRGDTNQRGQDTPANSSTPTLVKNSATANDFLSGVVSVAVGNSHTCALLSDGSAKCWGTNSASGSLGTGTTTSAQYPLSVVDVGQSAGGTILKNVVSISAGSTNTYFMLNNGDIMTVGDGSNGLLQGSGAAEANTTAPTSTNKITGTQHKTCSQFSAQ